MINHRPLARKNGTEKRNWSCRLRKKGRANAGCTTDDLFKEVRIFIDNRIKAEEDIISVGSTLTRENYRGYLEGKSSATPTSFTGTTDR